MKPFFEAGAVRIFLLGQEDKEADMLTDDVLRDIVENLTPACFPMPRRDGKLQCNCPFCADRLARFHCMEAGIAEALQLPGRRAEPQEALDYGVYLLAQFAAEKGCSPEAVGRKMYECISMGFSRVDAVNGIVTGLIPVSRVAETPRHV